MRRAEAKKVLAGEEGIWGMGGLVEVVDWKTAKGYIWDARMQQRATGPFEGLLGVSHVETQNSSSLRGEHIELWAAEMLVGYIRHKANGMEGTAASTGARARV